MKRMMYRMMAFVGLAMLCASQAVSQPPDGPAGKAPPPRGIDRRDDKDGPMGPPRFELEQVFPPPMLEQLELTPEQEKALKEIRMELKAKLEKLLTPEQMKKVHDFRPPSPRGPGGPDGPDGKAPPPPRDRDGKAPPPRERDGKDVPREKPPVK